MRPLDVVRTPGAAADLMRALQTLPGIAQVDEGAGLYVRGGDTSEVLVLLDDAVVFHPYRAETPGGGLFGSVEPFLLEGVSFATGGFSARYGNALSAVLDMHGLRRPDTKQVSLTLGLAGASIRAALPIGERGGVRISGNRSFPGLLFAVNGRPYDFNPLPGGWDVNGSAHYNSPAAGHFKAFVGGSGDGVGVHIDSLSFAGLLTSSTVRFSDRLRVSVDVPDPLRSLRVPPFLLQPLVENAIRHGVAPVSGPVFVRIAAHRIGDRVRIEVVDSGRGFDYTNGARRGLGLQLTERRLHAHARLGELSVERRADGFAVVVTLPA